jgi:hypothetical protein
MDEINIIVIIIAIIIIAIIYKMPKVPPPPPPPPPPTPLQLLKADSDKAIELAKNNVVDAIREINKYMLSLEPNVRRDKLGVIFNTSELLIMIAFLEHDRKMVIKNDILDLPIQDPAERIKGFNVPIDILNKVSLAFTNIKKSAQSVRTEYNEIQKK